MRGDKAVDAFAIVATFFVFLTVAHVSLQDQFLQDRSSR
jgi:hypothetical protein